MEIQKNPSGHIQVTIELPRLGLKILLAALSLAASLAVLEIGVRYWYRPFFELGEYEEWVGDYGSSNTPPPNRYGHREEEITEDLLADEVTRILFLGDSFTYGHGVEDGSVRFTDRIERSLNEGQRRYHVYNSALSGENPQEWLQTLVRMLPDYAPDVVIGVFFLRCGTSMYTSFRGHKAHVRKMRRKYRSQWAHRYFATYRAWADRQVRREFTRYFIDTMISSYVGGPEETKQWHLEQEALLEIQRLSAERGLELQLVVFPMLFELEDYPFMAVEEELARFARESGIPLFSLTPAFTGRSASDLWVLPSDQHPNPEGHRIAAEALLPWIETLVSEERP